MNYIFHRIIIKCVDKNNQNPYKQGQQTRTNFQQGQQNYQNQVYYQQTRTNFQQINPGNSQPISQNQVYYQQTRTNFQQINPGNSQPISQNQGNSQQARTNFQQVPQTMTNFQQTQQKTILTSKETELNNLRKTLSIFALQNRDYTVLMAIITKLEFAWKLRIDQMPTPTLETLQDEIFFNEFTAYANILIKNLTIAELEKLGSNVINDIQTQTKKSFQKTSAKNQEIHSDITAQKTKDQLLEFVETVKKNKENSLLFEIIQKLNKFWYKLEINELPTLEVLQIPCFFDVWVNDVDTLISNLTIEELEKLGSNVISDILDFNKTLETALEFCHPSMILNVLQSAINQRTTIEEMQKKYSTLSLITQIKIRNELIQITEKNKIINSIQNATFKMNSNQKILEGITKLVQKFLNQQGKSLDVLLNQIMNLNLENLKKLNNNINIYINIQTMIKIAQNIETLQEQENLMPIITKTIKKILYRKITICQQDTINDLLDKVITLNSENLENLESDIKEVLKYNNPITPIENNQPTCEQLENSINQYQKTLCEIFNQEELKIDEYLKDSSQEIGRKIKENLISKMRALSNIIKPD